MIPKDTENLIQQAENSLKKNQEKKTIIKKKEKPKIIEVVKEGDIDPLETNEWLSLSAVIENVEIKERIILLKS